MALSERKLRQLFDKIHSLKNATLADWIKDSSAGGKFQIHNSQMTMVKATIETLYSILQKHGSAATENNVQTIEKGVLVAFQVWEFFRAKLAQRLEPDIQPFLRICDELAWKCYEPFRDAAGSGPNTKEPPLLFLDSDWSPFVVERNQAFEAGTVPRSELEAFGFQEAVARMPFAVIGLPWYQRNHLPDALIICHEVGHAIEQDFDLGDSLDGIIDDAVPDASRAARWKAWRREVFADTIGCLSAGPSFVSTLADALVSNRARVIAPHATYPSDYLRILYNLAVLRSCPNPFIAEAAEIEEWWTALYGGSHSLEAYEADLTVVAEALIQWRAPVFGGQRLPDVLAFSSLQQQDAEAAAAAALSIEGLGIGDIRVGFAAARVAFHSDSKGFAKITPPMPKSPQEHLQDHLFSHVCKNDLRGRSDTETAKSRLEHVRGNSMRFAEAFLDTEKS